jgi:hypothetical protein
MAGCAFGYPLRTADYKENFHLKSCSQEFSQLKRCGFFFFPLMLQAFSFFGRFFYALIAFFNNYNNISVDILYFRF